jgi:hypothetical protein
MLGRIHIAKAEQPRWSACGSARTGPIPELMVPETGRQVRNIIVAFVNHEVWVHGQLPQARAMPAAWTALPAAGNSEQCRLE